MRRSEGRDPIVFAKGKKGVSGQPFVHADKRDEIGMAEGNTYKKRRGVHPRVMGWYRMGFRR